MSRAAVPLVLGGQAFGVRVRSRASNRVWQDQVKTGLGEKFAALEGIEGTEELWTYLGDSSDVLLDLVIRYDETNVLPAREWIDDNATEHEVLEAFMTLGEQSFPFFEMGRRFLPADMRSLVMSRIIVAVLSSSPASPTKKPSPPGPSKRRRSSTTP